MTKQELENKLSETRKWIRKLQQEEADLMKHLKPEKTLKKIVRTKDAPVEQNDKVLHGKSE